MDGRVPAGRAGSRPAAPRPSAGRRTSPGGRDRAGMSGRSPRASPRRARSRARHDDDARGPRQRRGRAGSVVAGLPATGGSGRRRVSATRRRLIRHGLGVEVSAADVSAALVPSLTPPARARREQLLDHAQVRDGIRGSHRRGDPPRIAAANAPPRRAYGSAGAKLDRLRRRRDRRVAPRRDEEHASAVGRDVERDLDRDPALRAVDVDALVRLARVEQVKVAIPSANSQDRRSSARPRRSPDRGRSLPDTRRGSDPEQHPRQVDGVAADVEQRAAAERRACSGCSPGRR